MVFNQKGTLNTNLAVIKNIPYPHHPGFFGVTTKSQTL